MYSHMKLYPHTYYHLYLYIICALLSGVTLPNNKYIFMQCCAVMIIQILFVQRAGHFWHSDGNHTHGQLEALLPLLIIDYSDT